MSDSIEWRVIPGFSRYSASALGAVRRDIRIYRTPAGPVSQCIDSRGYWSCSLTDDAGKQRKVQTHRLIALAFLGRPPSGLVVCHGRAGSLVNEVGNLRYDTPKANMADKVIDGTQRRGSQLPHSKLSEDDAAQVLRLIAQRQLTHKQIGALYGIDGAAVGRMATGKTWRHVPRPANMPPPRFSEPRTKAFREAKRALKDCSR